MSVINVEHISKLYGDKMILEDLSCSVDEGDKIGIIGINGTGKSTLLRIIAGEEEADEGKIIQMCIRDSCNASGIFIPKAQIGSYVREGQMIGSIVRPILGAEIEEITVPCDGMIFSLDVYKRQAFRCSCC